MLKNFKVMLTIMAQLRCWWHILRSRLVLWVRAIGDLHVDEVACLCLNQTRANLRKLAWEWGMPLELNATQTRVLGALIEKELTTPDQYPLTLAALVNACNQKTSREPVMALSDAELQSALQYLIGEFLVRERNPAGSRVPKFAHRMNDSLGLSFVFKRSQLAVLAVLMLRGAQTPGELKTRSERLRSSDSTDDINAVLESLITHTRGPWVFELPREPGRRESRWTQLLDKTVDSLDRATGGVSAHADVETFDLPIPGASQPSSSPDGPTSLAPSAVADAHSPISGVDAVLLVEQMQALREEVQQLSARVRFLETELGVVDS